MTREILIIQGHPDPAGGHFCHALADAYRAGAVAAGHHVEVLEVGGLDFPLLRSASAWQGEPPAADILRGQELIRAADHLVIFYPLWLGALPAVLKGFLEQVFRPGFAISRGGRMGWRKGLKGKTATVVVTMGMPALAYRWFYRAHSLKSLKRNILGFVGIRPVAEVLIGNVEGREARRNKYLQVMTRRGARAH